MIWVLSRLSFEAIVATGHVIDYLDKAFGIKRVYGSAYHPQSQGIVERCHRNMLDLFAILRKRPPSNWEAYLPRVQFALRSLPRKALGGRSPIEIVTGLRPTVPSSLSLGSLPAALTADDYCKCLIESMLKVNAEVHRSQLEAIESSENLASVRVGGEFSVGDLCLVRKPHPIAIDPSKAAPQREGAEDIVEPEAKEVVDGRVQYVSRRLLPRVYRVVAVVSPATYKLADAVSPDVELPYPPVQNITRLVRLAESWFPNKRSKFCKPMVLHGLVPKFVRWQWAVLAYGGVSNLKKWTLRIWPSDHIVLWFESLAFLL